MPDECLLVSHSLITQYDRSFVACATVPSKVQRKFLCAANDNLVNVQSSSAVTDSSQFQVVIFYDDTADMTLISQLVVAIKQSSYTALANAAVYHLPGGLNTSDALVNAAVLAITSLPVVYLGFCSNITMFSLAQKVRLPQL